MADGKVVISTELDNSRLPKGIAQTKGALGGLGNVVKKLGGIIAAAFSVKVIADFAKECLDLGSDLQEVQNVVDVTFTTMNEQVNEFARNAAKTAGLSETMAKRYAGTFGAMAKSFKFTEAESYEMSTALTQLSGDVASFYNLSQGEAYTKLKSVFTGETESLKDLGVVMTQTALDSYALANGFGKTTSEMTEQEKVALRYRFVMDQLSGASGDFLRTSDSWANQTRLLTLQLDQLKATLGQGFINVLTPAVKLLNTMLSQLQGVAEAFRNFTTSVFGSAGNSAVEKAADGYNAAAEGAESIAENTEKAGKAAKKYLASFDELTIIGSNADKSGIGSAISGITNVPAGDIVVSGNVQDNASPIIQAVIDKIMKMIDPLRNIDFGPVITSFGNLRGAVKRFGETVLDALGWAWDNILVPLSKWTIEKAAPDAVNLLASAYDVLSYSFEKLKTPVTELGTIIADALGWAWDNILVPLGKWTIEDAAPAAVDLLASAFDLLSASLDPLVSGIKNLWVSLDPAFQWIGDTAVWILKQFEAQFNKVAQVFREKGPEIEKVFSGLGEIVTTVWALLKPVLDELKRRWGVVFDYLGDRISFVVSNCIDRLGGLVDFFAGVFTGDWKRAVNGIIAIVNSMISGTLGGINLLISAMNKFSFKVPNWVPLIGGNSFGFNIPSIRVPQIPYLAQGAVIPPNREFLAVLGDQRHGTNIEAPLSTIQEAVAAVMENYEAANLAGHEATVEVLREILEAVLGISIGDDVIGQAAARYNRKMAIIRGGV